MNNWDLNKIYKYQDILKYLGHYKPNNFQILDKVLIFTSRTSSSSSSWCNFVGKHHGWILIKGKIIVDKNNNGKIIKLNTDDIDKWSSPIGMERSKQNVAFIHYENLFNYVVEKNRTPINRLFTNPCTSIPPPQPINKYKKINE